MYLFMNRVRLFFLLVLACVLVSCERDGLQVNLSVGESANTRKVMLLYEAGFNSLSGYISRNISQLRKGYLPGRDPDDDVLLVVSHLTLGSYSVETSPVLLRIYDDYGVARKDTLFTWPVGTSLANKSMVTQVFDLVRTLFPAASYGAVMSSHSTGWLPAGYFSNPIDRKSTNQGKDGGDAVWLAPRQRTYGQEYVGRGTASEEIEIYDLAKAIPYHLDYLLFDACLMGTVEVAWQLRDVCDYLAVSSCEIPGPGYDYTILTARLLKPDVPDLQGACYDYYKTYEHDTTYGATITLVDCRSLDPLAEVCKDLFSRYRTEIRTLSGKNVQVYDRQVDSHTYHAFFDLKDMMREAGVSESDLADLQAALDKAVIYEAHTDSFMIGFSGGLTLERCCGLSMYLPSYPDGRADIWHGTPYLDDFYKNHISWNQATSLVE